MAPTIHELISSIEDEISNAEDREERARREIKLTLDEAQAQGRQTLTAGEAARSDQLFKDIETARAAKRRSEARLSKAQEVRVDEERIDAQQRDVRDTGA